MTRDISQKAFRLFVMIITTTVAYYQSLIQPTQLGLWLRLGLLQQYVASYSHMNCQIVGELNVKITCSGWI